MVFVVGARRSGTLWVQRVLAAHPGVSAVPTETYLFSYGISQVFDRLQHGLVSSPRVASVYADRDEVIAATRELCDVIFRRFGEREDSLIVERTPWHAHHLDLIGEIYPDARIVHVIRDGRDVARSLVAQPWGPNTIAEAATEWRETVEAARSGGEGNDLYREVRYETLLADPAAGARELYDWLGIDDSAASVELGTEAAAERQNLGAGDSVGAGKWRAEWSPGDLAEFEAFAGELREQLGYPHEELPKGASGRRFARRRKRPAGPAVDDAPRAERPEHEVLEPQRLIEDVVAALRPGGGGLGELLGTEAAVRVLDGSGAREAKGERGLELLAAELAADPAFAGRQLGGESFPGIPSTTVSLVFELADGERASRVLVLRQAGGRVAELTLIRPAEAG
jgi:hypothetical protein